MELAALGWNEYYAEAFAPLQQAGMEAARVAVEHRGMFLLYTSSGEYLAEMTGRLQYLAETAADLPKVGDWVAITRLPGEEKGLIHSVLPRRSKFSRLASGGADMPQEQILAANVDTVFIVQGLDNNFNLRRLERYLVTAHEGQVQPVVVLNKSDLVENADAYVEAAAGVAPGVQIITTSAHSAEGLSVLRGLVKPGRTYAFIGSSGVGKSSLINVLLGDELLPTQEVRADDSKGRHTTVRRELVMLPDGGLLMDTPGLRELGLWHAGEGMLNAFPDVEELAGRCHFSNCTHTHELKCAVLAAVERGDLAPERYESYIRLQSELDQLEEKQTIQGYLEKKRKTKTFQRAINRYMKNRKKP